LEKKITKANGRAKKTTTAPPKPEGRKKQLGATVFGQDPQRGMHPGVRKGPKEKGFDPKQMVTDAVDEAK